MASKNHSNPIVIHTCAQRVACIYSLLNGSPAKPAWLKQQLFGIIARHCARHFDKASYDAMLPASPSHFESDD
jgi:hypothetical protein